MTKDQIETATWGLAHEWHTGLGLEWAGIELGDLVTYSILTVINRLMLQHLEQESAVDAKEGR